MQTQFGYPYMVWRQCFPDESGSSSEDAKSGTDHPKHEFMQRKRMEARLLVAKKPS